MRDVDNNENILDSRDVIKRRDELRDERKDLADALDSAIAEYPARTDAHDEAREALQEWDEDNAEELKALDALCAEGEGYGDWDHGETLIRDSYFEEYAQELAEDIGAVGKNLQWPACHIDWEASADALKIDYTAVDFDGVTYWMRA